MIITIVRIIYTTLIVMIIIISCTELRLDSCYIIILIIIIITIVIIIIIIFDIFSLSNRTLLVC